MNVFWESGYELNSVTDAVEFTLNSGSTLATSSSTPNTGTYKGTCVTSVAAAFWRQHIFTANQNRLGWFKVSFKVNTRPGATIQLIRFSNTTNISVAAIVIGAGGALALLNQASTNLGSSAAVSTGVWHTLELKCDSTNATGTLDAWLDGISFASGNNSTQGSWARVLWGAISGASTQSYEFDDIVVSDSQAGDMRVIQLLPNADGDNHGWTHKAGGAGDATNYTEVSEAGLPDDATTYVKTSTDGVLDYYNMANTGLTTETIYSVSVNCRFMSPVGVNQGFKVGVKDASGGTIVESATIGMGTATTWFTNTSSATGPIAPLETNTKPSGGAWTPATVDTAQAGIDAFSLLTNEVDISTVWLNVVYLFGSGTSTPVGFYPPTEQPYIEKWELVGY